MKLTHENKKDYPFKNLDFGLLILPVLDDFFVVYIHKKQCFIAVFPNVKKFPIF